MTNKFIEQRVEALENELSELKLIVAQIRKPSAVVEEVLANDIIEFEGKQYKKVDREAREGDVVIFSNSNVHYDSDKPYKVFKDAHFVDNVGQHKTANQQRAEIIEKAKKFVEFNSKGMHVAAGFRTTISFSGPLVTDVLEFVVNEEKRTVVALIKGKTSKALYARGIAKCMPSDVFNEHIGKAIALGRALGLDVSEFEQAVQPTVAVGQVVTHKDGKENRIITHKTPHFTDAWYKDNKLWNYGHELNIINDTNAQYETAVTK